MATVSTNSNISVASAKARAYGVEQAPTYMAQLFILSLVVPILIRVGPVLLMPHRIVLLVFFIPCMMRLWGGRAGKIIPADWLMLGSAIWALLALLYNHGGTVIEAMGIHMIEFFGAYLLARVSIRSADDFYRVIKVMFFIALILLPLAATESIMRRNYVLEFLPGSIGITNAPYRWGMRRAQTLFTHPIHFGVFAALGMGLYWYCLKSKRKRLFSMPMVIASTVFSLSSGALIALVCQFFLIAWEVLFKRFKSRWKVFAGIFASLFVLVELTTNRGFFLLLVTYASFNTGSAFNRILIWNYGTKNVKDNPIFGLGFREWERAPWMSTSADNFWLLMAMMFGLPSFIMFASAVINILWRTGKAEMSDSFDKACRAGFLTAAAGIIIGGGTVHYWTAMMALVLFFFGSAAWMSTDGALLPENEDDAAQREAQAKIPTSRYTRFAQKAAPLPPQKEQLVRKTSTSQYKRNPTLQERRKTMRISRASKKT
jgi:hypothetical protein